MCKRTVLWLGCLWSIAAVFAADTAPAAETVALRLSDGRFLRVGDDGAVRPVAFVPGERERFDVSTPAKQEIVLRTKAGRFVVPDLLDLHALRLSPPNTHEAVASLELVPAGGNRFALRPRGSNVFIRFSPSQPHAPPQPAGMPATNETVEIYRVKEIASVQNALSNAIPLVVQAELTGKQYDKSGSHDTNKFIELPAPTLKDPERKKRVQVLGMTEEYRIQAALDGTADIRIPGLLFLAGYGDANAGRIIVSIDARLLVKGRVEAKIPNIAKVAADYRAVIELAAVAEVGVARSGGDVKLGPCAVNDLRVSFSRLDLSNDLLEAARRPIKRLINYELERNEQKLREGANKALEKAITSHDVNIPLIGYLTLP